jgi:hypothetical protein
LDAKLPSCVNALVNCGIEILSVVIGVLTTNLQSLIPDEGIDAEGGCEVKLDKMPLASLLMSV